MSVVVNATIMYAALTTKNDLSDKYQVDLCELSPTAVRKLEEMGVKVNNNPDKPEKGDFITCRSQRPIFAYDTDGNALDGSIVGNGSKAAASIGTYEWNNKFGKGTSPTLGRLVVTELEIYDGDAGGGDVDLDAAV